LKNAFLFPWPFGAEKRSVKPVKQASWILRIDQCLTKRRDLLVERLPIDQVVRHRYLCVMIVIHPVFAVYFDGDFSVPVRPPYNQPIDGAVVVAPGFPEYRPVFFPINQILRGGNASSVCLPVVGVVLKVLCAVLVF
jgi:hypothetical protein